jgi:hypothetical protein
MSSSVALNGKVYDEQLGANVRLLALAKAAESRTNYRFPVLAHRNMTKALRMSKSPNYAACQGRKRLGAADAAFGDVPSKVYELAEAAHQTPVERHEPIE